MGKGLKARVQATLWTGSILLVIAVGFFYFPREDQDIGWWERLYFTLRLFVFEHDLPAFPKSWPLMFVYFLAPAITLSAVGTAISYLFRFSPSLKTRWMSGHVVIGGMGRTGKLFASALIKEGVRVVGIDMAPPEDFDEWSERHNMPVISGDFNLRHFLEKAGAARARAIVFASGDDLANLEGALAAYDWLRTDQGTPRLIWTQIATEQLANTARSAVRTQGKVGIRFFDTYRIAAVKMVAKYFNREIRKGISEVTIVGFGKFGRDLMEILVSDLKEDERFSFRVIDVQDRGDAVMSLAEELNIMERVSFQRAAIQDIRLMDAENRAFFICTDDDLGNLTATMALAQKVTNTHIYVRMDHWPLSAVAENLGQDRGIFFINLNALVLQGIEALPGLFEPAEDSDLKRVKLGTSP
jgi:Trk K+ transport system NAD-binding subunit